MKRDASKVDEVIRLLCELREAWQQLSVRARPPAPGGRRRA